MKNKSNGRLLAQTYACRPYQDNYDEVMKICRETGRKPAEVLRDALDEWLLMRHGATAGSDTTRQHEHKSDIYAKIEELQRSIDRLAEQYEKLAQRLCKYEIFLAIFGAVDLIWRDIPNRMCQEKQRSKSKSEL